MARISPTRFINLKSKVKAECNRRNSKGSVASYAGSQYDFTIVPASENRIREEHYEKNAIPMNAINSLKIPDIEGKDKKITEENLYKMESLITSWASTGKYNNKTTDCNSSCTGLCYSCSGSCSDGCSGCTNRCDGCTGCSGSCDGSCTQTCGGSGCSGACSSSCYSSDCSSSCGSSCANCGNNCSSVSK